MRVQDLMTIFEGREGRRMFSEDCQSGTLRPSVFFFDC